MTNFKLEAARRIPRKIRKEIIENELIEKSETSNVTFEYLFDIYEHFIDIRGEHDDYNCAKCRNFIKQEWLDLKQHLETLNNEDN